MTEQAVSSGSAACFASSPSSTICTISPTISTCSLSSDGVHNHPLDQTAQDLQGLVTQRAIGQRLVQPLDLGPVDLGEVRVEPHQRWGIGREFPLQGRLARLELVQLLLQAGGAVPLDQRLDGLRVYV